MLKKMKQLIKRKPKNENQEAKHAQIIAGIILMIIFFLGFCLFVVAKSKNKVKEQVSVRHFDGILEKKFNSSTDEALIEKQDQRIDHLSMDFKSTAKSQEQQLLSEHEKITQDKERIYSVIAGLEKKIGNLERENKESKTTITHLLEANSTTANNTQNNQLAVQNSRFYQQGSLRHMHLPRKRPQLKRVKTNRNYVWAGTSAEGVLLTGIIGDAGINGTKNRSSGVIRLIDNGSLPNKKKSFLKDCLITYSGYGDLSAETAVLHLSKLSCAGSLMNFEKKVYGSVFDADAMQDLRGIAVLNSKPMLGYSGAAGILGGIGEGLKNAGTIQSYNTNGTISTFNPNSIGQQAIGRGLSNPADKIADYVMRIADIYHPVVVVKPGRKVTIVFLKGFWTDDETDLEISQKIDEESRHYRQVQPYSNRPKSTNLEQETLDKLLKANPQLNQPLFKGVSQ